MSAADLAVLAATSGHSGVDRVLRNLVPAIAAQGFRIDVLAIDRHGPYFDTLPMGVRRIALGTRHVNTALPALLRYLRASRPAALLSDKDRVNRLAIVGTRLAGVPTRVGVRLGTTVSVNLASRGWLERRLQLASMRHLYPWAHRVLVPSQGAAEDLAAVSGLAPSRIAVVPSPVITARLSMLAAEPVSHPFFETGEPVVIGVGELSERKDFATLLRAFARLNAQMPARLIVLGEGRRRAELTDLAASQGVSDRVSLPGFVANPYAWMARASVFALSSRWEGMPVVLIEALALGRPCVACDCPSGPREVLAGQVAGVLVPVGDDLAFADALARLLSQPPSSTACREAVIAFDEHASARAYLDALGFAEPL